MASRRRTQIHCVVGPLGAGKSSLIKALASCPRDEDDWAALINEVGDISVADAAAGMKKSFAVRDLLAGCLCCTATGQVALKITLAQILRKKPSHLFLEASGQAKPAELAQILRQQVGSSAKLGPIIGVLSPRLHEQLWGKSEAYNAQVENAEVLVLGRMDEVTKNEADRFEAWCRELVPPKRLILRASHGVVPDASQVLYPPLPVLPDEGTAPQVPVPGDAAPVPPMPSPIDSMPPVPVPTQRGSAFQEQHP